jgi:two-component system heavy metal sensor histidine kinase CusS
VQWTPEGRTFRGLSRELPSALADRRAFRVTIGVDTAHHDHYMQSLRRTLWTFVAIAVLATGLLGWIAARSGLAPLRRLGREAEGVTASRLDRRLSAPGPSASKASASASWPRPISGSSPLTSST